MNVLVVATKSPWPPVDGGRLLLANTLEGLAKEGCRLTLVAPVDPGQLDTVRAREALGEWCEPVLVPVHPVSRVKVLGRAWRLPLAAARHVQPAVSAEVEARLASRHFDLVHVEQLQALSQAQPAFRRGLPVVLRAQNVESDLWRATARAIGGWRGQLFELEAQRLARWEGGAVRRASAVFCLTDQDSSRLRALAHGGGNVQVVRAPFPEMLPASSSWVGEPPVVLLVSRGWLPNEDSVRWFLAEVWPAVRSEVPGAVLHLFGAEPGGPLPPGAVPHPAPQDSADAFAPGSILVVPLRIASGVRMKVLEAWARGVPVIGTSEAVSGIEVEDGRDALVADGPLAFAQAVARLHREPELVRTLTENGRRSLRQRHDPAVLARQLLNAYVEVVKKT